MARTVFITGTSTGIGLSTAVAAARAGWRTVATMRDTSKADALRAAMNAEGLTVDIRRLDVTDGAEVQRVVDEVVADTGSLDAVVNNAGAAYVGTVERLPIDTFRAAMEVNYFGVVQVTRAAMPHLRAAGGRVVTVSSVGGIVGQPFNEAYCAAKFAVEGFLESLHPVAGAVGVQVNLIEPGAVSSEFVANAGLDPATMVESAGPYGPALSRYLDRTTRQFAGNEAQTPADVARVIVDILDGTDVPFRTQTSEWARNFVGAKLADLDGSAITGMTAGWVAE